MCLCCRYVIELVFSFLQSDQSIQTQPIKMITVNRKSGAIILFLSLCALNSLDALATLDNENDDSDGGTSTKEKVLSRKRRYLIFPVGSSLQLVYDSVVTVPDYTLYIVTGITVALAWGLPDKPVYPEEDLMNRYENGELPGIQYRKDENVTETANNTSKIANDKTTISRPAPTNSTRIDNETLMNTILQFYQQIKQNSKIYHSAGYPSKYNVSNNRGNYTGGYYFNKYIDSDNGGGSNGGNSYYNIHRSPDSYYFGETKPTNRFSLPSSNINRYYYTSGVKKAGHNEKISYSIDSSSSDGTRQTHGKDAYNVRPPLSPAFSSENLHQNHYDAFTNFMAKTYFRPWIETSWKTKQTTQKPTPKPTAKRIKNTTAKFKPVFKKVHRIYPAIGKRSISSQHATYEEKFYLDHHRHTRHELYEIIEKYLFAKGYNGTACVLKTLCEVGQKRSEEKPGSFLAEIVRVIFSLPDAQLKRVIDKRHISYDNAHQTDENCVDKFVHCPVSIWDAGFLIETYDE